MKKACADAGAGKGEHMKNVKNVQKYVTLMVFIFSAGGIIQSSLQSWTKSVKNFTLPYAQETHPVNLASLWPLPPPLPWSMLLSQEQKCSGLPPKLFFWRRVGGSILSKPGFRGKYSKIKLTRRIFLNIFVQNCICECYVGNLLEDG